MRTACRRCRSQPTPSTAGSSSSPTATASSTRNKRRRKAKTIIVWISGAYGVGKSALAENLAKRIENAMIFDAEEVGNAVRENYPNAPYGVIFEDYPLWSRFCCELLKDVHNAFRKNILVPMTLVRQSSYASIIGELLADGIDVRFIILEASHRSIHDRILARGEDEDSWCMQNIEMASAGSRSLPEGFHVNTDNKTIDELADIVMEYLYR